MTDVVTPEAGSGVGAVRAAVGAVTTTIASVIPVFLVGGLAVQLASSLHFSPAGLGLLVAVYFGGSALSSIPSGRLVERYGPELASRAAILLSAAAMLALAAFTHSYLTLLLFLAVGSAANALGQLASNMALARHVPPRRQGLSFGVKQSAIPISTLLAGAAVPTIAVTVGWRWAWAIAAVLALAALPLVPRDPRTGSRGMADVRAERATKALIVVGAAATLAAGAANALGTFLVASAAGRGLSPGLAGLTLTFGSAVCIVGRIVGGWLADHRSGNHIAVLAGMLGVGAVGLLLLAAPGVGPLVAGTVLAFGLGWSWPGLLNFAVVQLNPTAPAAATSITQSGVYLGGFVGPLILGAVAAATSYRVTWVVAAAAMFAAAALMVVGSRMLTRHARRLADSRDGALREAVG